MLFVILAVTLMGSALYLAFEKKHHNICAGCVLVVSYAVLIFINVFLL